MLAMATGFTALSVLIVISNWLVCPTLGAASLLPTVTSDMLTKCYEADQFRTVCTDNFHGVVDGGRCFYLTPFDKSSNDLWVNGWKQCTKYGSKLANMQTEGEFKKVVDLAVSLLGIGITYINLGMKDENGVKQDGKCAVNYTTTNYWYQDQTTAYTQISPAATWLGKYHMCDDINTQTPLPRCWVIFQGDTKKGTDGIAIGDFPCSTGNSNFANLCEFSTKAQSYAKTSSCVAEPPIQTSTVTARQDCADSCTLLNWCRGFNLIGDPSDGTAKQCQLYTWSIDDKPLTKSDPSCVYYSYVPQG